MRSRWGDLLRFGWFNLHLYRFSQGILNLVTKIFDCVCGTYYNQNRSCGTRTDQVTFTELGGSTCIYTDFHRGFLIWSQKSLIVSVAPTITRIVAVAQGVDGVTFSDLGGSTCV